MTGARWLADERHGRHDLGERIQPSVPARLEQRGGDPLRAAPHVYPFVAHMDDRSVIEWFMICRDAGLVQ